MWIIVLIAMWIILLILIIVIINAPVFFLFILLAIGVVCAGIYANIDDERKNQKNMQARIENEKKERIEKERQRNISIAESAPPAPVLIEISTNTDFSCKEEEKINLQFREYCKHQNKITEIETLIKYLKQKRTALIALDRQDEANKVEMELSAQNTSLFACKTYSESDAYIFKSELNDCFYRDMEKRRLYNDFTNAMAPSDGFRTYLSDFFKQEYTHIFNGECRAICLTPCYAIFFERTLYRDHDKPIELKVIKYDDVKIVNSQVDVKRLIASFSSSTGIEERYIRYCRDKREKTLKEKTINCYCGILSKYFGESIEKGLNGDADIDFSLSTDDLKKVHELSEVLDFEAKSKIENNILLDYTGREHVIKIPEDLVTVVGPAFHLSKIESIELPDGILEIQSLAFNGCSSLTKLEIPNTVRKIGSEAFSFCSNLKEIKLPRGLKTITKRMLAYCTSLEEIIIPDGVTIIDDEAFCNCNNLKKVVMADTVKIIGKDVFKGCRYLEQITLSSGIKEIPKGLFRGFSNLTEVTVASDIVKIDSGAFAECRKLRKLYASGTDGTDFNKLEKIGDKAFYNCTSFEGFDLGNQVTYIGESAFAGCRKLKDIKVSAKVDWHRKSCFNGTPWLKDHAENGYVIDGDYLEIYVGKDEIAVIPPGVKTIGKGAFYKNTYIKEVKIPNSVTEIETFAFANCRNLLFADIPDSVAKIADTAFFDDKKITIRCSRGSIASKFRIEHKIKCEYVSKSASAGNPNHESDYKIRTRKANLSSDDPSGFSGLTEAEYNLIMELRRQKLIEKQEAEKKAKEPEPIIYSDAIIAKDKVGLTLIGDSRVITNNIFNIQFTQTEPVSDNRGPAEYEVFMADKNGQIISNIKGIKADKTGGDMTYKVTLNLFAHGDFDKEVDYFIMLRYKGGGSQILSRVPYKINIEFAAEFDF